MSGERDLLHSTCVAKGKRAILIVGPSGVGKSDLALRLIDRGWTLISDDQTHIERRGDCLFASPPDTIAGQMEVRGLGIIDVDHQPEGVLVLHVLLTEAVDRMPPEARRETICGVDLPSLIVNGRIPSAPIVIDLAMDRLEDL